VSCPLLGFPSVALVVFEDEPWKCVPISSSHHLPECWSRTAARTRGHDLDLAHMWGRRKSWKMGSSAWLMKPCCMLAPSPRLVAGLHRRDAGAKGLLTAAVLRHEEDEGGAPAARRTRWALLQGSGAMPSRGPRCISSGRWSRPPLDLIRLARERGSVQRTSAFRSPRVI